MPTRKMLTIDGNEAAASAAYRLNEGRRDLSHHAVVADGRAGRRVEPAEGEEPTSGGASSR